MAGTMVVSGLERPTLVASACRSNRRPLPRAERVRALIRIRLGLRVELASFEDGLLRMPWVRTTLLLAGDHDLAVLVDCSDFVELDEVVHRLVRLGAEETQTQLVLRIIPEPPDGSGRDPR